MVKTMRCIGKNRNFTLAVSVIALVALLVLAFGLSGCTKQSTGENVTKQKSKKTTQNKTESAPSTKPVAPPSPTPKKAFVREFFKNNKTIHFLSSDPPNNALLPHPPEMVTIRFLADLGSGSFIKVTVDGKEVSTGSMILPVDNRSMSVRINPYIGTGNYKVFYTAYWSDGSYCEGSFGFSVQEPD